MIALRRAERLTYASIGAIAIAVSCAKAENSPLADRGGDDEGGDGGGKGGMSGTSGQGGSSGATTGGAAGKGGTTTGGAAGKGGTTSTGGAAGKGGTTSTGGAAGKGGSGGSTPTTFGCLDDGGGGEGGASGGAPGEAGAGGAGPSTLFSDDFEDGDATGWTPTSGTWSILTDGTEAYAQADRSNNDQHISAVMGSCWGDQIVEARVKVTDFGGNSTSYAASLFARYLSAQTHYIVGMDSGNNGELFIGRRIQDPSTAPDRIITKTGLRFSATTWYKLRLEVVGATLKAYLDDELQLETTDAQITSGGVAVGTRHASARFDDVKVTAP